MTFAICIGLSVFFLLLSIHPFVTYPLSLMLVRRRPSPPVAPSPLPTFAICVCAYNEERTIAEKARNMIAVAEAVPNCELFIYVDGASDRTLERLGCRTGRSGRSPGRRDRHEGALRAELQLVSLRADEGLLS